MKRAIIVRDNRYKENWGCRATSIALTQIVSQRYAAFSPIGNKHDINSRIRINEKPDFVEADAELTLINFLDSYTCNSELKLIYDSVEKSDLVIINGEGCQIFCNPYRRDLAFSYFVIRLSKSLNKPVFYVNGMMSSCPSTGINRQTVYEAQQSLRECDSVCLRDKYSFRMAHEIGIKNSCYIPDALFSWSITYSEVFSGESFLKLNKEMFSFWPEDQSLFLNEVIPEEYVCVSGASFHPYKDTSDWPYFFASLIQEIKERVGIPVVVVMPGGDYFLQDVAKELECIFIPGSGNILISALLLSKAIAYVSGRYHPSIMASLGGTPCVFLESNSHKTESLQEVLGYEQIKEHPIDNNSENIASIVEDLQDKIKSGKTLRDKIAQSAKTNGECAISLLNKILLNKI